MPPVRIQEEDNDNNNSNEDNNNNKTNGEVSDKSENEIQISDEDKAKDKDKDKVKVKDKDKDIDKKLDEGFVSDGSEKKISKSETDKKSDKLMNGDISATNNYENVSKSPKKHVTFTQMDIKSVNTETEKKMAPVPKDIYGTFPVSPIKFSGPKTPIQKLQTVSLKEAQKEVEKSKMDSNDIKELPKPEPTKILDQIHVSIPVQQLDIRTPIHVSQSQEPQPHKPQPSVALPQTTLYPKSVKLEPIGSRSPSRSRSPPKISTHLSPRPSPVPSRSPSRERDSVVISIPSPRPSPKSSPRPSRKDIPSRKDVSKQSKDAPTISVDKSKDRSPAQKTGRQPPPKKPSILHQSTAASDLQQFADMMAIPSNKNKGPADFSHKLIALCRKGDWVGVDTVIKYAIKHNVEPDLNVVSEHSGWTPIMFAVKDNRIQIVEQLLDLEYPVNTKAKVQINTLLTALLNLINIY
jgi:hypothetical protein